MTSTPSATASSMAFIRSMKPPLAEVPYAVVAGRRARGVRAVPVQVPRRVELVRVGQLRLAHAVEPGADHLVIAGDGSGVAGYAGTRPLLVDDGLVRTRLGQWREARALRPEAGVHHADDDTFAGPRHVAELPLPDTAGAVEPEEPGRGHRVDLDDLVLPD